ncbi:MAG: polyprenyl synthetase family protein [Clostridiales bacterium]|jgi:geranylgeranyl diphosphate synthase type II|nr:polyprenyl synthetase family protein [Clostridiales bacterium]
MNFNTQLQEYIGLIDHELERHLQIAYPEVIYEAARYSLFSGGKRIRPVILLGVCDMLGGRRTDALPFACALEMIHTYSLIHDDLPALDNDDSRRGKPTCHVAFGEAMALLAGDALLNRAYEIMSNFCIVNNNIHSLKCMAKIANYAGISGMIGGQVMDIRLENAPATAADIEYIYKNKTAKLFMAAFGCGALSAGRDNETVCLMENIGLDLGMAFQLKDDSLDSQGDQELGKPTYAAVLGIDAAKKIHDDLSAAAIGALKKLENSDFMLALTENLLHRTR